MDIPIYKTLEKFKQEFEYDYEDFRTEMTYLKYLRTCREKYFSESNKISAEYPSLEYMTIQNEKVILINILRDTLKNEDLLSIENDLFDNQSLQFFGDKKHLVFEDCGLIAEDFYTSKNNVKPNNEDIINFSKYTFQYFLYESYSDEILQNIYKYLEAKEKESEYFQKNYLTPKTNLGHIIDYLEKLISEEKLNMLRFQNNQQPQQLPEPLSASQKEKVGLLIRTGIVDFLTEKYNANPNQIAKFFALITAERLEAANTNPHFSINNKHYAIQNPLDITDLDLKIKAIFKKAIL